MGVLDRLLNKKSGGDAPPASTKAAIIRMAAECRFSDDDAKEFASEHTTVESANTALIRYMAMNIGGDVLSATQVEAVVKDASTPEQARVMAADMVVTKRQADEGPEIKPSFGGPNGVGHSWDHGAGFQAKMIGRRASAHESQASADYGR